MEKLPTIFLICSFVLGFYFQSFAFNGRDSIQSGPERDSSLSVKKITDIRQRFAQKGKYYLDYIQNQSTSPQDGSFWVNGSGIVNGSMLVGTSTDAGYKLDINGTSMFRNDVLVNANATFFSNLNARVIRNAGTNATDGLWLNYASDNSASAHLRFFSGGNTEAARIAASSGNLLIGTTMDNGYKLDVNGETVFRGVQTLGAPYPNLTFGGVITVKSANTNNLSAYGIKFDNTNTGTAYIAITGDNANSYGAPSKALAYQAQSHVFYNGTNQLAQIASNGNVLIGTSTDNGFKLNVNGNTSSNQFWARDYVEVQKTFGVDYGVRLSDPSGGYLRLGGVSSAGFTPGITMHPDPTWNTSYLISITNDVGTYPAIFLDGRSSSGALATKDILWIGSYSNPPLMKVKANGNVLIGNATDAGYKLDVNGAGRFSNTVKVAIASSGQDILQLTNPSGNNVVVNQYGELLVGLSQRTGTSLLHVADGPVTFDHYVGGGTAAAFFDGAGNFYKSNLQWVNNELYWWDKSSQVANSYKLLLNYGYSNGEYALQVKGDIYNGTMANEINDPDRIVVNSGGVLRYMTKAQLGIGSSSTTNAWSLTGNSSTTSDQFIGTTSNNTQPLIFKTNGNEAFRVNSLGELSIGTPNSHGYKLAVDGNILTQKIKVTQAGWPDYVFNSNYKLPTLKHLEEYIKQNKHLPDVPSEKEVQKNGLDVGDNQALLLKKIEELTLYIIEQDKKIEKLESQNKELLDIKSELEIIRAKLK